MTAYQNGNVLAFKKLYERHSGRVFDYLQKKIAAEPARELVQEVFFKLHRSRHRYSAQYPFLPWLFTIVRNVFVDFVRLNETKVSKNSFETEISTLEAAPDLSWSEEAAHALGALPNSQRRAMELRYLGGWSFEQIAREMSTTPMNVRQMISRSLRRIRSKLGSNNE